MGEVEQDLAQERRYQEAIAGNAETEIEGAA